MKQHQEQGWEMFLIQTTTQGNTHKPHTVFLNSLHYLPEVRFEEIKKKNSDFFFCLISEVFNSGEESMMIL